MKNKLWQKMKMFDGSGGDLLRSSLVFLLVSYFILFCLESVLPGLVISVFNFNLFLFLIVALIFLFSWKKNKTGNPSGNSSELANYLVALVVVILCLALFVILYKISLLETFLIIALTLLLLKSVYAVIK